jgi:hypothetical protein
VLAAVLALIVGGGAGFFGQRYLAEREVVTVTQGGFSVDVPRGWAKSVAQSVWQPPGSTDSYPALRVSQDADWSSTPTPGIFVGVADAKLTLPDSSQFGCKQDKDEPGQSVDGQKMTIRYSSNCGGAGMVLLQRVVERGDAGSMLVQVMVPNADRLTRAIEMADSVKYSG